MKQSPSASRFRAGGIVGAACICAGLVLGAAKGHAEASDESLTIEDGAKVFVCDDIGLLSIVKDTDDSLSSPQYPFVNLQHAAGVFVFSEPDVDFEGLKVNYTSFLKLNAAGRWEFTGFDGATPFIDVCQDITGDLAFAFPKLAIAASWGLPQLEQRVALFDAIMDDMRTRLELASIERDTLREEKEELTVQLASLRMETCETATEILAAFEDETPSVPGAVKVESAVMEKVSTLSDCLENTVLVGAEAEDEGRITVTIEEE